MGPAGRHARPDGPDPVPEPERPSSLAPDTGKSSIGVASVTANQAGAMFSFFRAAATVSAAPKQGMRPPVTTPEADGHG